MEQLQREELGKAMVLLARHAEKNCNWELKDGIFTVSAKGNATGVTMNAYTCRGTNCSTQAGNRPWEDKMQQIEHVVIEDNIVNIGDASFAIAHNLKTVTGMNDVTTIGWAALAQTESLTDVEMPNVKLVGQSAFDWATSLTHLDMPKVEQIKDYGFCHNKSLISVSMPNLKKIGTDAFADNPALSYIDYDPSKAQWTGYNPFLYGACSLLSGGCTTNKCANSSNPVFKPNPDFKYNYSTGSYTGGSPGQCVASGSCGTGYTEVNGLCKMNPKPNMPDNCVAFSDGCTLCDEGYLTNEQGTCTPVSACNNGLHATVHGACVPNDDINCNTQEGNKCTECKGGYLEQSGSCVTSCGAGYKQIENWCNRIQYTPAEAAPLLNDDNNTVTITFKK